MGEITPGRAMRDLQQAQQALRRARQLVQNARESGTNGDRAFEHAWEALRTTHRVCAAIPASAADPEVLLRAAALLRYGAALLVRVRRLATHGAAHDHEDEPDFDGDEI